MEIMLNRIKVNFNCNLKSLLATIFFALLFSPMFVEAQNATSDSLKQDSLIDYYEAIYTKEIKMIIVNNRLPDSLFKKLYAFAPSNGSGAGIFIRNNELLDSFMLYKIRINKEIKLSPSTFTFVSYSINLLSFNSKTIYFEFVHSRGTPLISNKAGYDSFINTYQKVYNKKINWKMITKDTSLIYGDECGFEGGKIKEMTKIEEAVQSKNIALLDNWLSSPIAELQAFAVNGFYQLFKRGYTLTPIQKKLVEFVKSKEGQIRTCSGCTVELREFKEILDEFSFE